MLRLRASGLRKRLSAQAGFSLVEQLVTMVLLSVVVGLTLTALETLVRAAPANQEWAHTVADTQAGLYQITRELRQGSNVTLVTPYVASADVVTKSGTLHVLYQCDLNSSCTRKSTTAPTAAPTRGAGGAVFVKSLQSFTLGTPVFTSPSAKYFQVAVIVRSAGTLSTVNTHNVTLTDGFFARNS
jgi:prepilin-type N-terminal cleavage/methylation domain-containing protein